MEMVGNCSFTLTIGNHKRSRLWCPQNGVPQGSVLAPLLFTIISDLPTTVSRKYAYSDNLAIMHADGDWKAVERVLRKNTATVVEYLQTWKLKLSTTKTVSAVFHLYNIEAKRELNVNLNNKTLLFCSEPKYLGVTLERSLTYRRHLESLRKKLTSRVALLRRLAGSGWGAGAITLRTATLALVHLIAEYCAPVWCRSAHTRLVDPHTRLLTLLLAQMGYGLLCGLWVWCRLQKNKSRPCCPPMSNPSASPGTARPDSSGRWGNRMAAQHLPRDLVQPSNGLKIWLKRRRKLQSNA